MKSLLISNILELIHHTDCEQEREHYFLCRDIGRRERDCQDEKDEFMVSKEVKLRFQR